MLTQLSDLLWSKVLVFTLLPLGLWFTVASRGVQFRYFPRMFGVFRQAFHHERGHLSSFQALALSLAGRVGGGNIIGVAVAISLGGPGAVFWMWLVGIVGMATSCFECSLAQLFKRAEPDGSYRGGPAFYILHGLRQRWLAVLFSLLLLVTFGLAFNALQAFSVAASLRDSLGVPAWLSGVVLCAVLGTIVFGGVRRIANVAEFLVPFMALAYVLVAVLVIALHWQEVPALLELIVRSAFGLEPAVGGGVGAAILLGVQRGLFSNEAGLGSAPNVAAVAWVRHPVQQGIVQSLSVFIDTLVICTCTAVIILLSGLHQGAGEFAGIVLTQNAMASHVGDWGRGFVSFALVLFAFSSILYNYYLGDNSLGFLTDDNPRVLAGFRVATLLLVLWGCLQDLGTVFAFADLTMGLLALVNLLSLVLLLPVALRLFRDYDGQRRRGIESPSLAVDRFQDLDLDGRAWQRD